MTKISISSVRRFSRLLPVLAVLIVLGIIVSHFLFKSDSGSTRKRDTLVIEEDTIQAVHNCIQDVFTAYHLEWVSTSVQSSPNPFWVVKVPIDMPVPVVHLAIQQGLSQSGASILSGPIEPVSGRLILNIGIQDSCILQVSLQPNKDLLSHTGIIALIIDDFGDRYDSFVESFFQLNEEITFSVIPGRGWGKRVAEAAVRHGYEVILHMPMEPESATFKKDEFMIMANMQEDDVRQCIKKALDEVPGIAGLNNHMGSRVTANRRTMKYILDEIKAKRLYFIDSRTTSSTVAFNLAQEMDIRCGKRDVFLDPDFSKETIQNNLQSLMDRSKKYGFAIGIGHCHRNTLEVLRQELPRMRERGFRFVKVSEVVR